MTRGAPVRPRGKRGRASVPLLLAIVGVLGMALLGAPIDHLARLALVLVVMALCGAVLFGADSLVGRLLPLAGGLVAVVLLWPVLVQLVRGASMQGAAAPRTFPDLGRGVAGGIAYHFTTGVLLALLLLAAAAVLLLSAKLRASLPVPRPPARPAVRRRARLVEPQAEGETAAEGTTAPSDDDFGLLGDSRHG